MRRVFFVFLAISMILASPSIIHGEEGSFDAPMANDLTLPINIMNDTHLMEIAIQEGWGGTGTKEDPIVIKDQVFDGDGLTGIMSISNTGIHLLIFNCSFNNGYSTDHSGIAIYLENTANVTISSCYFYNISTAISALGSDILIKDNTIDKGGSGVTFNGKNTRIINCSISNMTGDGISTTMSENCEISYNMILNTSYSAISGHWVNINLQVHHNNISNSTTGIRIYSGADLDSPPFLSSINNNTIINSTYAIIVGKHINITDNDIIGGYQGLQTFGWNGRMRVVGNTFTGFSDFALWAYDDVLVDGNVVSNSAKGIVTSGRSVTLRNNLAINNTGHGFEIMGDSHIIEDNVATGNNRNGFFLNASKNLTLENIYANENKQNGILFYQAIQMNCTNLEVKETTHTGIKILDSKNLSIENSYSYENDGFQIMVDEGTNITLKDTSFFLADTGMQVTNSTYNLSVKSCSFTNLNTGIIVTGSNDLRMRDNQFWGCGIEFDRVSDPLYNLSMIDIDDSNTVNGRNLLLLNESSSPSIYMGGAGQIIVYRSSDHLFREMDLSSTTVGMQIFSSTGIIAMNITLDNDRTGIRIHDSVDCIINTADLDRTGPGIEILSSLQISIQGCKFTKGHGRGILIDDRSSEITIKNNLFFGSEGDLSYAIENHGWSITVYLNMFIYNRGTEDKFIPYLTQVKDEGHYSVWKVTPWGNYWRDLHEPDTDGDGLVDVSYLIEPDQKFYDPFPAVSCPLFDPPDLRVDDDPVNMTLILTWTAPDLKDWSTFTKFNIFRRNGTDDPFLLGSASPYSRIYIDASVQHGIKYGYYVTAVNEYTESDPSLMVRAEVDENPPLLYIISPRQGEVLGDDVIRTEWVGVDNESGIDHFEVKIDLGDWINVGVATEHSFFNLVEGTHILKVKAFDISGKESLEQITFLIDRGRPTVTIDTPSDGEVLSVNHTTVRWSATDGLSMIEKFEYSIDGGNFTDIGAMSTIQIKDLEEGSHEIEVIAYDQAGNENSTRIFFTVDTISPEIDIYSPTFGDLTSNRNIEVAWLASDKGTGIFNFEIQIDDQPWLDTGLRTKRSFYQVTDGQHTIRVRVKDHAGNTNGDEVMVTIDGSSPDLEITFPLPGAHLSQSPVTIQWQASDEIAGMESVQFRDNQSGWRNVSDNRYPLPALEEGSYQVWVRAFDRVGNSIEKTTTFTIDRTPPEILEFGPVEDDTSLDSSIFVSFSERMARGSLAFEVEGVSGSIIWRGERAVFQPNSGILEPGRQYNISVRGSDLAGNMVQPVSWTFNTTILGKVRGRTVTDNDLSLPDVEVTIDGQTVLTRPDGGFFIEVTHGTHELILKKDGYKQEKIDVNITAGSTLELGDIEMKEKDDDSVSILQLLLIPAAILLMVLLIFFGATFFSRRMKIDLEE